MSGTFELPEINVEAERPAPAAAAPLNPGRTANLRDDGTNYAKKADPTVKAAKNELVLQVAGQRFTGWKSVRIGRGIEAFPSFFALSLTERLPENAKTFPIQPGQRCKVLIGSDLIITGYVETYRSRITPKMHEVYVTGRSKTADLVDCQAGMPPDRDTPSTMTYSAPSMLALAKDLCDPFGIEVTEPDGEGKPLVSLGDGIPQFTMPIGTTVYQILEDKARWLGRLLLDGTDGNLILGTVAKGQATKGRQVTLPGTCEAADVSFSTRERFSVYFPIAFPMDAAFNYAEPVLIGSSFYEPVVDAAAFKDMPRDDGKARFRPIFVESPQTIDGIVYAELAAKWRRSRDYGRSQVLTVTVSTWRDGDGKVWEPNTLATVHIPRMKLEKLTWVIASVEFRRGLDGTHAILTLMPPEAFEIEPVLLTQFDPRIAQAVQAELDRRAAKNPRAHDPASGT